MSTNYWPQFWTDVQNAIESTWPEVSVIFRSSQIARLNWSNVVEEFQRSGEAGLPLPYCVVQIGAATYDPMWGGMSNTIQRVPVHIYYVCNVESDDVSALLEERVYQIAKVLESNQFEGFQIVDGVTTDVSDSNPANSVFLQTNVPLMAAAISVNALVGERRLIDSIEFADDGEFGL
jgi:hypothetical protein